MQAIDLLHAGAIAHEAAYTPVSMQPMDARSFWQLVYDRFDPERPVNRAEWRAERPYSPRGAIEAGLNRPFISSKHYVVLGTVGTGKSTELLAIAQAQTRSHLVVFLDVWRHFQERIGDPSALNHVQPWEVLLLVGLAVYGSAKEILGHEWAKEHLDAFTEAVSRFRDAGADQPGSDGTSVDVAKLAGNLAALAGTTMDGGTSATVLAALGTASKAARWDFRLGGRDRAPLSDQDERVRGLRDATNLLIGTIQEKYRKVLVVVDGLDRIKSEPTTRGLFIESTLLGSLIGATVLTGPLILRQRRLAAQMRIFEPRVLANVPVMRQDAPRDHGPGIDFFLDVYRRRLADPGDSTQGIPAVLLHRLAYYSGGRIRDFVRLVRMVAERAWDDEVAVASPAMIDDAIDERRRVMEMGLDRGHINLLADVMSDPEHLLPEDNRVEELLEQWCLLPFPNESEWYYPHPLLTIRRVRIPG